MPLMSAVRLYELERGVLLLEGRDPRQGDLLKQWIENTDAFIAVTAQIHSIAVITRNVSDFARFTDLDVHNPWSEKNRATQEQ